MARIILITLALAASVYAAHAIGVGGEGRQFGRMGATAGKATSSGPPVSCASTGIYDLSNVCNDVYFLGALK